MDKKTGLVTRATGSWYTVRVGGQEYECRMRGRIRLRGSRSTNPIVVGDYVELELGESPVITALHPRRNYIIRKSINLSRETHIIAANLDQAYVVVTLAEPATPLEFVDRFLATCTAYDIPATILLNKQDLATERKAARDLGLERIYQAAGYEVLPISAIRGKSLRALKQQLAGRISLLAGNSGVGKTSIINSLEPGLELRTAELSEAYGLGRHTTTFSEVFRLSLAPDSYLIDTPGIKGFGVVDFEPEEIAHFFPDLFAHASGCRFTNCLHDTEPGCAVVQAVAQGEIATSRYRSYLSVLHDGEQKYR